MLLWPSPTMACDLRDVSCHGHNLTYNTQKTVATTMWIFVRGLLMLARVIEGFRVWLVDQVLREVLAKVLKGLEGVFVISVLIAVLLLWFSFFVQSLVSLNWVDTRRALRNGFFAVMIFLYGAQLAAGFEQFRILGGAFMGDLARTAVESATNANGVNTFSGPAEATDKTVPPGTIYLQDPCETGAARATPVIMLNDLAANYVFATARDIHCPINAEGEPWMPEAFWDETVYGTIRPDGARSNTPTPGFFAVQDIGRIDDEIERQRILNRAGAGVTRMSFAIPMALMGLLEQIVQLLYSLCLMAIWFGLSISLILSLYLPTEGMFTALISQCFNVLKGSLLSALYIGIGSAVLQIIITSSNSNGLVVGLVGILVLILLGWIIKQAAALFLSTITSVGSSTAQGFGGAVVGAAIGAAAVGGVLAAQAARKSSAYNEAYEEYAEDYGTDTKQQRSAAKAYAKRKAADATRGTMTQDLMRVMRAGTDIASATRDPLGTLARVGDRMAIEQQNAGIRDELRGLRQDMAGPQGGTDDRERASDAAPLTSAQAGAAMAGGQTPQSASDGRRKLRDLVASARRDGRLGTTSSLREVDEEIERLTTMSQGGALQLDQQGALMDDGERKRLKERLKQLDAAIREQRELRSELAKVMSRSERDARGDLSHQARTGAMSTNEASEVMRRRRQGLATAEQASDAAVILGEAARKRASAQDWRYEEGDATTDAGARQMVGRAVGGLQREVKSYQVDADRARRTGDVEALMRAERGEADARYSQGAYRALGNAVRTLERPNSTEEAKKAAVEHLERAARVASDDYSIAAERGNVRDMREAEQRGMIARQALGRVKASSSATPPPDPSQQGGAQEGGTTQPLGTSAPHSAAAAGQSTVLPTAVGAPGSSTSTSTGTTGSSSGGQRSAGLQPRAPGVVAPGPQMAGTAPTSRGTVPLGSGQAATTVAPVTAAASEVPSAPVAEAARATAQTPPVAVPTTSANGGNVGAPAAAPSVQAASVPAPSVQAAPAPASAAPAAAPSVQAAPTAVPAPQAAPAAAPESQPLPAAAPSVQAAPTAVPAPQAAPVPSSAPQAAPAAAPNVQAAPVPSSAPQAAPAAAPSVQVAPAPAPSMHAAPTPAPSVQANIPANGGNVGAAPAVPAPSPVPAGPAVAAAAAVGPQAFPVTAPVATPVPNLAANTRPSGEPNQPSSPTTSSPNGSATGPKVTRRVASIKRDRR
jgi:hypothetical protein